MVKVIREKSANAYRARGPDETGLFYFGRSGSLHGGFGPHLQPGTALETTDLKPAHDFFGYNGRPDLHHTKLGITASNLLCTIGHFISKFLESIIDIMEAIAAKAISWL